MAFLLFWELHVANFFARMPRFNDRLIEPKKKQQIPRPSHEWISTRTRAILLFKKKINYKIELLFFFTTDQPMAGLVS